MPFPTAIVTKTIPFLVKQLPKLWPLLLDAKNREIVMGYAKDIADRSPQRRLAAKIDLTVALSESMAERATTTEDQDQARRWQKRAAAMRDRLALPVMTDKRTHRAALAADLQSLHEEMSAALREDETPLVADGDQSAADPRLGA